MGSGLPQTVLLVQLSEQGKKLDRRKLEDELYEQTLEINAELDSHLRIACVIISDQDWNAENGLVTHTMKIKRAALEEHYGQMAERVFTSNASSATPLIAHESTISSELT